MLVDQTAGVGRRQVCWSVKPAGVGREVCLSVKQLGYVCWYVGRSKQLG